MEIYQKGETSKHCTINITQLCKQIYGTFFGNKYYMIMCIIFST